MIEMDIYFDINEIEKTAGKFLNAAKGYNVLAFSGELGAGKTTFIAAICKEAGVTETVTSPTFSIIQQYETNDNENIFHIDLYRLKNSHEAMDAGIEDCLNSGSLCLVEWPEKAPEIFPDNTVYSTLEILSETKRKLMIKLPA